MSVQLNWEHPQGTPGPMKPSERFPIDTVLSWSFAEVLSQQSMFVPSKKNNILSYWTWEFPSLSSKKSIGRLFKQIYVKFGKYTYLPSCLELEEKINTTFTSVQ